MGILSIARARSELKQLCCCINPDFSVKMSNIPNFVTKKKKNRKKKKEKRGGHIIKCLLTELGRAGRENIWPSVMAHAMTSGQIFSRPALPLSQLVHNNGGPLP